MKETEENTYTNKNEKLYPDHGLEELILLKWPYYPRQSTGSVKFLSKYRWHFHRTRTKNSKIFTQTQKKHKRSQIAKTILRKNKAGVSHALITNYITKLR